jgi:UDP-N-acetylglucosamine 2-epimerase (non-hydrolysing)
LTRKQKGISENSCNSWQKNLPRPDVNLEVGSGSHAQQAAQVMLRFEPVLLEYKPDWAIAPGDVNSPAMGALTAHTSGAQSMNPKQNV